MNHYFRIGRLEFGICAPWYVGKDECSGGCIVISLGWVFLTWLGTDCAQKVVEVRTKVKGDTASPEDVEILGERP